MFAIDPKPYDTLPVTDADRASALAGKLQTHSPPDPHPLVARALQQMIDRRATLDAIRQPLAAAKAPPAKLVADRQAGTAWSAFHDCVVATARLPHDRYPRAAKAARIKDVLFPTGTGFLNLAYDKQYSQAQLRLDAIEAEGIEADIVEVTGPDFLAEIRRTHAIYGEVQGITGERPALPSEPESPALAEAHRSLRAAIAYYVTKLIGTLDEQDAEAVASVRLALKPIDDLRAELAKAARSSSAASPAPAAPAAPEPVA